MSRDDDEKTKDLFRRRRDEQRAREFAQMARRLQKEREAGRALVERLLRDTPRDQWPLLAERHDLATAGTLEHLGNTVGVVVTKDPVKALAIAELAVAVAEGLALDEYPNAVVPQLRAHAWKDFGKALRYLGRNAEALDAFDTAEAAIEGYGVLVHDRALVRFHRAASLQEVDRFEESREILVECKQVFHDHGDTRNGILCGFTEGVLLQRLQRYREARECYLLLFASGTDIERETRAALHRAIGLCSIELGDFREAEVNLKQAIALNETLGQPVEVLKSKTAFGRLLLRAGDPQRAITYLRPVRREFLRHRLVEEAGICGLEIVEAFLNVEEAAEGERLARQIIGEFAVAGFNNRAIGALGWLSEAIAANRASPAAVTRVREYIVSLRTSPERDFVTSS